MRFTQAHERIAENAVIDLRRGGAAAMGCPPQKMSQKVIGQELLNITNLDRDF